MKNRNRTLAIIFGLSLVISHVNGQETIQTDPIRNFKNFYEIGISMNGTRVNTNHTQFNTSNGTFDFRKNNYLPTLDASFNYGWLLKDKEGKSIWTLKTGVNVLSRNANLVDSIGNDLRLSTIYMQIPVQFGFRIPLKYNTVKNNFFRAIEVNAGVYVASPVYQKLDHPDNLDSDGEALGFNYYRFGFIGEVVFTTLDSKGHGHKFGIRVSNDFTSIAKVNETDTELYPYYYTIGIFYNFMNRYK